MATPRGMINIDLIDARRIHCRNCPRHRMLANALRQHLAPLRRQAAWNRATRAPGRPGRESQPPPPRIQTAIRVPLHPRPPPAALPPPRLSFRSAACNAASSAAAAWPRTARAFVQAGDFVARLQPEIARVVHHLRREQRIPASDSLRRSWQRHPGSCGAHADAASSDPR